MNEHAPSSRATPSSPTAQRSGTKLRFREAGAPEAVEPPAVAPPVARSVPYVTEVHGERLEDAYHWLREREAPEVRAYLEAENGYTAAVMRPARALEETLYREIVDRIQETDTSAPVRRGPYWYYTRTEKGRQYPIYARKHRGLDAEEEVLLDVDALAAAHSYYRVPIVEVSRDHRLLAYAFDVDGSEEHTLVFKDLATGELLADRIAGVASTVAWASDHRTVLYTRRDRAHRPDRIMRHVLGAPADADEEVYRDDDGRFYVSVHLTRSERFVVATSASSITSEQWILDADRPDGAFRVVRPRQQGVEYSLDHHGDHLYLLTNHEAKCFRLMRVPVDEPGTASEEVISHRPRVTLEDVLLFRRHLVVFEREAGLRRVRIRGLATGVEVSARFPETVHAIDPGENPAFDTSELRVVYTSMVTPPTVYDVDLATGALELRKRQEVLGGYDPAGYETRRLFARASDGVAVPVLLLHRRGLVLDGRAPCLLYGYGAYGISLDPAFSSARLTLVDRGMVVAVAQVRGGGELGETWHDGGKMQHKATTFEDFVSVAELLIEQGYTAPARLVAQGGSAGGMLIGAVLNRRPELFHAAVAQVPFVDVLNTMLDESLPLTVGELEEWGDPKRRADFDAIRAYSPYDNVRPQAYPHLLVTAGLNDPRVQYWEPAKWVAKLRATATATATGDRRLLLKTNMDAGHQGASGRYDALRELAFVYAFMLDCLGIDR